MKKSIIDATAPVREHFKDIAFHDFKNQVQGQEHKVLVDTWFVGAESLTKTKTSLYRPPTKDGDPRIWHYALHSYARPNNLLALLEHNRELFVVNCSEAAVLKAIGNGSSPLFDALNISRNGLSIEALELLEKLKGIGALGWIQTMRAGDTGVGFTLETLLGIAANSSTKPDYKGVEIKSSRKKSSSQSLFGKTPDWKNSRLKGSIEILHARGRYNQEKERLQLFHSISAQAINSYGLQLEVDVDASLLKQFCVLADRREDDVQWELDVLKDSLLKKHRQTFWVKSESDTQNGEEKFRYYEGTYTRGPNVGAFPLLIEAGDVFVDYTIKERPNGSATDQGYLFRMKQNRLALLFGEPKTFALC